jgi:hypothetical protein
VWCTAGFNSLLALTAQQAEGCILKVTRDAVAAGEEQLAICAAEQSKYFFICTVTLGPCGDLPFTSWSRWH